MTAISGKICLNVTILQTVFYIFIFSIQVNAFSLRNCTVKGELNNIKQLKVLCYKMGFHKIPLQIPNSVRYLDVSFNSISSIRVTEFKDLWNLRNLNLSHNKISFIEEGTTDHFPNLTNLNLANNKLKTVSNGLLQGLNNLEELRFDFNLIERVEQFAFSNLRNLKLLNLTNNNFQRIATIKPVFSVPTLEELFIGCNNFSEFNSYDMSSIPLQLKKIDISYNPLTKFQINENIFQFVDFLDMSYCGQKSSILWNITDKTFLNSVKTLYMSGVHIPQESIITFLQSLSWASLYKLRLSYLKWAKVEVLLKYACLPELRVLRLKGNSISKMTDHMFKPCSDLEELDLSGNRISYVSSPIFKTLTQLKILRLQVNVLTKVNRSFQDLTTLEFIDLSRNRIKILTCLDFANLTHLTRLYLYSNRISKLPSCVFKDLKNLENLRLGTNNLLTIGSVFENSVSSLLELQLTFNKLSTLQNGSFKGLSNLNSLSISDNQISEISKDAFTGLFNLTDLLLSSNRITEKTIRDPAVFSGMPKLKNLELYSNVISYNKDYLQTPPFIYLTSLRILTIHSQRRGMNTVPSNFLHGLTSLEMFYGGNMNLNYLHPDTFNSTPRLWFLELSKNTFSVDKSITAEVFHPIPKLNKLIISRAQLHSLNFVLNANLSRLAVLQASANMLDVINYTWIQSLPHLKSLDLRNNTFTCDCNNAFFIKWAMQSNYSQVVYLSRYTCSYPPSLRGTNLLDLNMESCNVNVDFICFLCSTVIIIFTLLVSFTYEFLRWQVLYAYYLFLAFLYDSKQKQIHQQHVFQYDAFISYNVQDEAWVVEELLPNLEGEQGWKLCLHHRDFEPGKPIIDNIVDGIYSSRKTICLITHSYLKSTWCSKEIQMANFRLFDEQKDVLILIFLEDIPTYQLSPYHQMRKLVKKKTYLKWPKPGENKNIFWQKLRLALETKKTPEDEEIIVSGI